MEYAERNGVRAGGMGREDLVWIPEWKRLYMRLAGGWIGLGLSSCAVPSLTLVPYF
jgi:hypothetical protein